MTIEETKYIDSRFDGLTTLMNAQFNHTHERLDKINGSVAKHEKDIQEIKSIRDKRYQELDDYWKTREATCPVIPRLQVLETDKTVRFNFKQAIVMIVTVISLLAGTTYTIIKINEGRREKDLKTIVTPLEKEIQDLKIK